MRRLTNVLQPYPWGSREHLARLRGLPPSAGPEAELWMGAHPSAPSRLPDGRPLDAAIAEDPVGLLGAPLAARYGRLPFLLKLLAAGEPLSLQAHPSKAQAEAGYAREEAANIPRGAPHRNYKDDNHKPELVCALGPFWALCGFREPAESAALLRALDAPTLAPVLALLDAGDLRGAFLALLTWPADDRARLLAPAVLGARRQAAAAGHDRGSPHTWIARLAEAYPGDTGALTAALLNLVRLERGEALYLPAGNLHAYLDGFAVEIMASSDNVLRGGLTPKHVDPGELAAVLDVRPYAVKKLHPTPMSSGLARYATDAEDFALAVFPGGPAAEGVVDGPAIVVAVAATETGDGPLAPGESVFVAAGERLTLRGGEAYVATAG